MLTAASRSASANTNDLIACLLAGVTAIDLCALLNDLIAYGRCHNWRSEHLGDKFSTVLLSHMGGDNVH